MKKLYTIIFCLFISSTFAQSWRYNYYDLWSSENWQNNSQQISVYRGDGRIDTLSTNIYQENAYTPDLRCNHIYNQSNQLSEKITSSLIDADARTRSRYTYNSDGTTALQSDEEWNAGTASWMEVSRSVFTYNPQGKLAVQLDQHPENNGQYSDLYRLEYTYDGNGKMAQKIFSVYDSGDWLQVERIAFTYTGSDKISTVLSQIMVSDWENSRMQQYTYNTVDSLVNINTERWTEEQTWENYMKSDFSYNSEGMRNLEIVSHWQGSWKNYSRRRFENDPVNTLSVNELESELTLFPNPVNDRLNIVSTENAAMQILFTDISGKTVLAVEKSPEMSYVSTETLSPGVYNVMISGEKGTFSRRIIKL